MELANVNMKPSLGITSFSTFGTTHSPFRTKIVYKDNLLSLSINEIPAFSKVIDLGSEGT